MKTKRSKRHEKPRSDRVVIQFQDGDSITLVASDLSQQTVECLRRDTERLIGRMEDVLAQHGGRALAR